MTPNTFHKPICLPHAPNGQCVVIDAADFCYAHSTPGHLTTITYKSVKDGKEKLFSTSKTKDLGKIDKQVKLLLRFIIRVHKSWMVNRHFIQTYIPGENMLIMKDDTAIPVGRLYKSRLSAAIIII